MAVTIQPDPQMERALRLAGHSPFGEAIAMRLARDGASVVASVAWRAEAIAAVAAVSPSPAA